MKNHKILLIFKKKYSRVLRVTYRTLPRSKVWSIGKVLSNDTTWSKIGLIVKMQFFFLTKSVMKPWWVYKKEEKIFKSAPEFHKTDHQNQGNNGEHTYNIKYLISFIFTRAQTIFSSFFNLKIIKLSFLLFYI